MADVHYTEQGSGPTLLCLHGIGSSSRSFTPQLDALADAHRVVAWDAPGYGKSPDPQQAPDYVAAVTGLIDELGAGKVHLLGVSWGGVLACQVALERPDLLHSLILLDASRGSGRSAAAAQAMRARAAELAERGPEAFARERGPRLVSPAAGADLVEQVTATMATAVRMPGYGYAAHAMAATDLTDRLAQITTPTLVLCGDEDTVTGPEESWALATGISDAVYVSVRGAGHQANLERPEAVNAWIASYIQIIERLYR
jgi:pimeloyl-ACP methyl ester carboxylesterase